MRQKLVTLAVAAFAAAALAGDGETPPAPAPAPEAGAAKPAKERKTSPEAEAAIAKYAGLLHFPSARYKTVSMSAATDLPQFGGEVLCRIDISADGKVTVDVKLSEAVQKQYGAQLEGIKKGASNWIGGMFRPFLVPADVAMKQYDLALKSEDGKTVLELAKFDEKAAWDKAKAYFNADGLMERQVGMPNLDPNDPMAAMNAGVEVEMKLTYKKRGELSTIEKGVVTDAMGDTTVSFAYSEAEGRSPLPKKISIDSPMMPLEIDVFDYVIDGKPVAGTERVKPAAPETPKPAPPTPK